MSARDSIRPNGGIWNDGAIGTTVCSLAWLATAASTAMAQCEPEWSTVGGGTYTPVLALEVMPDGDLVVGGYFVTVGGGVAANRIARWDGALWSALGQGLSGTPWSSVQAIKRLPSGELAVGGDFFFAGGVEANRIARWDGTAWSTFSTGMNGEVRAMVVMPSGDFIVGGNFNSAGGESASRVARWTGSQWSGLGSGTNGSVLALTTLPSGDLIAGGTFNLAGNFTAYRVARWDGSEWHAMGGGLGGGDPSMIVSALATLPSGDVMAGGSITNKFWTYNVLARWDGTDWSYHTEGPLNLGSIRSLAVLATGDVAVGGDFTTISNLPANHIATWNLNTGWSALGQGLNATAYALTPLASGDLYAGGVFGAAGGTQAFHLARWGCPDEPCEADCDASGVLSIDDFICFQTFFVLGDAKADCDASGTLTIDDFVCFQTAFVLGC